MATWNLNWNRPIWSKPKRNVETKTKWWASINLCFQQLEIYNFGEGEDGMFPHVSIGGFSHHEPQRWPHRLKQTDQNCSLDTVTWIPPPISNALHGSPRRSRCRWGSISWSNPATTLRCAVLLTWTQNMLVFDHNGSHSTYSTSTSRSTSQSKPQPTSAAK